jgi:2-iminobutanoate/2-iminopropanoate deaminase
VNAYLSRFDDFEEFNGLYVTHFSEPYPARTTVQVGLYGFDIEIEAWARRRSG